MSRGARAATTDRPLRRIVVDENVPGVDRTFARHARIERLSGRGIDAAAVRDADALIVRSVTPVGPDLLDGSAVRFVGSATIGTDHLDTAWLDRAGIRWAAAPGCNADAAAQYTLAMMLLAGRRLGFELPGRRIGIVGRGNVGSRILRLLEAAGADRLAVCDPPLAAAGQSGLSDMAEIQRCDIISLHVPLTSAGRWPTRNLLDAEFLSRLPADALIVNTARGAVIDPGALADWLADGRGHASLDVWPGEPAVPAGLIEAATIATPHVAGYSLDGKLRGTLQIYQAFCDWLGAAFVDPAWLASLPERALPDSVTSAVDAVLAACPVERDDAALRALAGAAASGGLADGFDALRRGYPERRDFAGWHVPQKLDPALRERLKRLGFH